MSKKKENPQLLSQLERSKTMGHILRKSIPNPATLHLYRCTLVSEQFKNQFDEISEVNYLEFIPKAQGHPFRININDIAFSSTALYELIWTESFSNHHTVEMGDSVGLSMAVNCLNYLNPCLSLEPNNIQSIKSEIKQELKVETNRPKREMNLYDEDEKEDEKESNFGSDEDSLGGQKEYMSAVKPKDISTFRQERTSHQFRLKEQRNVLDYSQSTKILIITKLIQFLKIKQNRIKKVPEIRYYLRTQKFNVPDKPLKEIISDLCISPVMDRVRGYLLKEKYLTYEEIQERRNQQEKGRSDRLFKNRKKRGKKQIKNEDSSQKSEALWSHMEEPVSPFEQLESKTLRRKKSSKKKEKGGYCQGRG